MKDYAAKRYLANKEAYNAASRSYYLKNKEKICARMKATRPIYWEREIKRFGLARKDYERILARQQGVCAICGNPPEKERLSVDHDHQCCAGDRSCGKCVRGLLCRHCNVMLGHAKDSIETLRRGINYLGGGR
jgi:hypothetical protein